MIQYTHALNAPAQREPLIMERIIEVDESKERTTERKVKEKENAESSEYEYYSEDDEESSAAAAAKK